MVMTVAMLMFAVVLMGVPLVMRAPVVMLMVVSMLVLMLMLVTTMAMLMLVTTMAMRLLVFVRMRMHCLMKLVVNHLKRDRIDDRKNAGRHCRVKRSRFNGGCCDAIAKQSQRLIEYCGSSRM